MSESADVGDPVHTATGAGLDGWGRYYCVPRQPSEADADYRARIVGARTIAPASRNPVKTDERLPCAIIPAAADYRGIAAGLRQILRDENRLAADERLPDDR